MLIWTSFLVLVCGTRAQYLFANCGYTLYIPQSIETMKHSVWKSTRTWHTPIGKKHNSTRYRCQYHEELPLATSGPGYHRHHTHARRPAHKLQHCDQCPLWSRWYLHSYNRCHCVSLFHRFENSEQFLVFGSVRMYRWRAQTTKSNSINIHKVIYINLLLYLYTSKSI
jgi:hypothetical protein